MAKHHVYLEGYRAYQEDCRKTDNPYFLGGDMAQEWLEGWNDASKDTRAELESEKKTGWLLR